MTAPRIKTCCTTQRPRLRILDGLPDATGTPVMAAFHLVNRPAGEYTFNFARRSPRCAAVGSRCSAPVIAATGIPSRRLSPEAEGSRTLSVSLTACHPSDVPALIVIFLTAAVACRCS